MRLAPLLQTKWNQAQDAYYSNMGDPCYNYYTPNNFPCGVADGFKPMLQNGVEMIRAGLTSIAEMESIALTAISDDEEG